MSDPSNNPNNEEEKESVAEEEESVCQDIHEDEAEQLPPLLRAIREQNLPGVQACLKKVLQPKNTRKDPTLTHSWDWKTWKWTRTKHDLLDEEYDQWTPLSFACFQRANNREDNNALEICKALLECNKVQVQHGSETNWLEQEIDFLLDHGYDGWYYRNDRALDIAISENDRELARCLLQYGANVLAGNGKDGGTALHRAFERLRETDEFGDFDIFKEILESNKKNLGPMLQAGDETGRTILQAICSTGVPCHFGIWFFGEINAILIEEEQKQETALVDDGHGEHGNGDQKLISETLRDLIGRPDKEGNTLLHQVNAWWEFGVDGRVQERYPIELLIWHGGRDIVNLVNQKNETALQLFAKRSLPKEVQDLLSHGANARIRNHEGDTALHLCRCWETARTILDCHPSAVDDVNPETGKTPLHLACDQGNLFLMRELLKHGANPSVIDKGGNSALHLAALLQTDSGPRHSPFTNQEMKSLMVRKILEHTGAEPTGDEGNKKDGEEEFCVLRVLVDDLISRQDADNHGHIAKKRKQSTPLSAVPLAPARLLVVAKNKQGQTPLMVAASSNAELNTIWELVHYQVQAYGTLYLAPDDDGGSGGDSSNSKDQATTAKGEQPSS